MAAAPSSPSVPGRVVDLVTDALLALLAVCGAVLLLAGSDVGLLALAVAQLGLAGQLLWQRRRRGPGWSPLSSAQVLRALVAAGTAVAVVAGTTRPGAAGPLPGDPLPAASSAAGLVAGVAAAALIGALVAEPYVARAVRFQVPVAVRLPGLPAAPPVPDRGPQAVAASLVAVAAGLLVALLGASPWWWLLICLLAVVPLGLLAVAGRAKIVLARRVRTQVRQAVADYAPEFILYTSRPDDASYQVLMWLPYLERTGLRFLVVTRNGVPARALAAQTSVPVVEARQMGDLDALVVPSLKAAFYVNASSGNGAFVRFQHLTHVYLGHGDSDKPPSYNPTHAMYDQVFAAGPAATRRYAAHGVRIPSEKFRVVGRPQVEDVRPTTRTIGEVAQPVVLYAPTWRGHVEETMLYSLPDGERIVSALLQRGATVVFRPHPFSYDFPQDATVIRHIQERLAADARRSGRAHLWGAAAESERGILDCINVSDAMVSDVSSVVSDYLFSGKPFAMVAVPAEPEPFVAEFPVAAASYVLRGDLTDLDEQLDAMLGPDPLRKDRLALRADYLGDFPAERYADAFVEAVRDVAIHARSDAEGAEHQDFDGDEGPAGGDEPATVEEGPAHSTGEATGSGAGRDDGEGGGSGGGGAGPARTEEGAEDEGGDPDEESAGASRAGAGRGPGISRYRRILRTAGLDLAGTAVAALALVAALATAPTWVVAVLGLLALGSTLASVREPLARTLRSSRLITEGDGTRAVLVLVLTLSWSTVGHLDGEVLAGLVVLAVALALERRVRSAWSGFGLIAVGLPAAVRPVHQPVGRGWLPMAGFVVLAVQLVLVALVAHGPVLGVGPASVVALVLAAVLLALLLVVVERALRRAAGVIRGEERLRPALLAHAPEFAVYFASTVGAGYQVGMWLPYFVRIGRPFVVVTRTVPMLRQIARLCEEQGVEVPVVHRPTLRSLEDVIVPSMTSAFYVNNAVRNTHFVERRELTHVWLNHGDSEKPACYNPVHAIYDVIFAAGQAGVDRYARHGVHIPREKFAIVGRPQVEQVQPARGPVAEQQPPTVLYAPTWQGPYADTRVFSLPLGRAIVAALLARGVRVVFRAHPFNYRYAECRAMIQEIGALLEADRERTGREHLWGPAAERELTIEDCFNLSDVMISDVSAVVSDYLRSDKPFAMVSVGRTPEQLVVDAPAARAAYVLREDLANLEAVLEDLLGADPLASTRLQTRIYYLGDFPPDSYADGFLDAARRVVDAGHARPEVTAVPEPAQVDLGRTGQVQVPPAAAASGPGERR